VGSEMCIRDSTTPVYHLSQSFQATSGESPKSRRSFIAGGT